MSETEEKPKEEEVVQKGPKCITKELLRKRSEHNEGMLSTLEEVI
jgi:hypothetical protein